MARSTAFSSSRYNFHFHQLHLSTSPSRRPLLPLDPPVSAAERKPRVSFWNGARPLPGPAFFLRPFGSAAHKRRRRTPFCRRPRGPFHPCHHQGRTLRVCFSRQNRSPSAPQFRSMRMVGGCLCLSLQDCGTGSGNPLFSFPLFPSTKMIPPSQEGAAQKPLSLPCLPSPQQQLRFRADVQRGASFLFPDAVALGARAVQSVIPFKGPAAT